MQEFPLTRTNRLKLARAFAQHPRVDTGIECALEDQLGSAWVDDGESPTIYLIIQGGFFCYVAGDATSPAGQALLPKLAGGHMLMPSPGGWEAAVCAHFEKLYPLTRHSFSSAALALEHLQHLADQQPLAAQVRRVDAELAANTPEPFLALSSFESAEDFVQRGIGYVLFDGDVVIGGAYSSLVNSRAIEVSLFVDEAHRRQGAATALSCALLTWCLEHQIRPNWDAANDESVGLATKLGYTPTGSYTAYFIP